MRRSSTRVDGERRSTVDLPASVAGAAAALVTAAAIFFGSRQLRTFDAALIGYATATIFLAFGVAYRYVLFGLLDAGPALQVGVSWARVGAAALSLALTAGAMVWLRVPHPPAGATTLIVSLGLITTIPELAVLMLGVLLLVVQGFAINRLAGVPYPVWSPRPA